MQYELEIKYKILLEIVNTVWSKWV